MQHLIDVLDQALDACFPLEKGFIGSEETVLRLNIKTQLELLKRKVETFDP